MNRYFSGRWHCALAFGLALALVVTALLGVALPFVYKYNQYRDSIADSRQALVRYRRIIAEEPALRARIDALTDPTQTASYYLTGGTRSLAAAALQDRVEQVIKRSGGALSSIQAIDSKGAGAKRKITVRVQMNGPIDAVRKVFYRLESGQPLLFLSDVSMRIGRGYRRSRRSRRGSAAGDIMLEFDVTGYLSRAFDGKRSKAAAGGKR